MPNGCYAVEIAPGVRIVCGNVRSPRRDWRGVANGVKFGRKRKLSDYQRAEALKRHAAGETLAAIAKSYGGTGLPDAVDQVEQLTGRAAEPVELADGNDARVSTHDRDLRPQLDALKAAGAAEAYSEKVSLVIIPKLLLTMISAGSCLWAWRE